MDIRTLSYFITIAEELTITKAAEKLCMSQPPLSSQMKALEDDKIKAGDVITMQSGCKHTVVAETELHMIEVQLGENISSRDKHKYEFDFAP